MMNFVEYYNQHPEIAEAAIMARRITWGAASGLALLLAPALLAGEHVRGGSTSQRPAQPAPAVAVRPAAVSIVVAPPAPVVEEPLTVDLRGPDGQIRRFPVEGGRAAIQTTQVVLRPGESVTIRWVAAK
jgi:hypothetical protein